MSTPPIITPAEADRTIQAARSLTVDAVNYPSISPGGLASRSHWLAKARRLLADTENLIRRESRRATK